MKKLLVSAAVATALISSIAHATEPEQISIVEPFLGGVYIQTTYLNWCELAPGDPFSSGMYAGAMAALENHNTVSLATVGQASQSYGGPFGQFTCDFITINRNAN